MPFPRQNQDAQIFKGFPNENLIEKMQKGFPFDNAPWYAIMSGSWNNPWIWRRGGYMSTTVPNAATANVTIYKGISITCNQDVAVNNLTIKGALTFDTTARNFIVNGNLQAESINMSGAAHVLTMNGLNNYINPTGWTAGTGTLGYAMSGNYNLFNIPHYSVTISNGGIKYILRNTNVGGNLTIGNSLLELAGYAFTVTGTTTMTSTLGGISKSTTVNPPVFIGNVSFSTSINPVWNFSSNCDAEFRGGMQFGGGFGVLTNFQSGTGTYNFTTNSQTLLGGGNTINLAAKVLVKGGITLTQNNVTINHTGVLDGDNAASKFTVGNTYNIAQSATAPMATLGIFDTSVTSGILGYTFNGNYTITYGSIGCTLSINGTGTKSLGQSTTIYALSIGNNAIFDSVGYNYTCTTITTISSLGTFTASGAGALLFTGLATFTGYANFSGNPSVEFRGGLSMASVIPAPGTQAWTFTTNNQNLIGNNGNYLMNILISGAITLTNSSGAFITSGTINGNNAASVFDNRANFEYRNATAPMLTGKLYCNQATNTFIYGASGNQDIQVPSDPTPGYKNLTLNGSGAKKLLGNVHAYGTYVLTAPATLNLNGYTFINP